MKTGLLRGSQLWLASLGWTVVHGPDIAPDTLGAERADYGEVVLGGRLLTALTRLNPDLPNDALQDALRRLIRPAGATLEARNRDFHRMLVAGVAVEYADGNGAGFAALRFTCLTSTIRIRTTGS